MLKVTIESKLLLAVVLSLFSFPSKMIAYKYLPVVRSYDKSEYMGGRQNWDIDVDEHGIVYYGNSNGLLRNIYGIWQLNETDNRDLIRSLDIQNDTIWCGGASDIGYFTKKGSGDLKYTRISGSGQGSAWNTLCTKSGVYFQTETSIFFYDKYRKELDTINYQGGFYGLSEWQNEIWAFTRDNKLGVIKEKAFEPYESKLFLKKFQGVEVRKLFVFKSKLHFLLFDGRIVSYDGRLLTELKLPESIAGKAFFTVEVYNKSSLCIGTVSDGLQIVDTDKNEIIQSVDAHNQLIDNTVLSLKRDEQGNVWLGLDYGLAYLETMNTIKPVFDQGATYGIAEYDNQTFLGTNKGLFSDYGGKSFRFVPGTQGQVWRLRELDNELYIGHNIGLLKYRNGNIKQIYDGSGVVDVARFSGTKFLMIATYRELFFAKEEKDGVKIISNVNSPGTYKLLTDPLNSCVWGFTGSDVKSYRIDASFELSSYSYEGLHNAFISKDFAIFYDGDQLLELNDGKFTPINKRPFSSIRGPGISALSIEKNGNIVAYIQDQQPKMLVNLYDGNFHSYDKMFSSVRPNLVENYEFISLNGSELRIATDRGVVAFNPESESGQTREVVPVIKKMIVSNEGSVREEFMFPFNKEHIVLPKGDKDVLIHFGINRFYDDDIEYRYQLLPYDNTWSDWESRISSKSYTKLIGGDYEFRLESRLNGKVVNSTDLAFSIDKFWYQTELIFLLYLAVFLFCVGIFVLIMRRITSVRIRIEQTKHGRAVTEQTLAIKNEQLLQYAEIIGKKNQFLMSVKDGLSRMRNSEAKHWERKIMDEVGNEKKNFFFHKLFSELHQDFINRLTEKHPNLTPHDVRILSFIRINLDTNEIANLLNISPRSVDINRYRIRKKLELPHEADLNVYIREL